jgi:shikimate kinase
LRGVGTARSAVSVVNALPLGIGAAFGIEWPARATVDVDPGSSPGGPPRIDPPASRTPLVRATAVASRQRFGRGEGGELRLVVRSTIPVARGLKSSSAVSSAVALATARAVGREPTPFEVARLSAEVGRTTGVSATGAFDDALAGLVSGGVVTDNRHDAELRRFDFDPELGVALWVPARPHPRSPRLRERFRKEPALAQRAVDAALDGDWVGAMAANSALVERVMGYRYERLHEGVRLAGATVAGTTGLGPAFAAVAPSNRLPRVLRALPTTGRRRTVRLARPQGSAGGDAP